jgi:hypothetical protein
MYEIRVEKPKLLTVLRENRDKHRELFLEAQQGYREEVIKQLDERLKDARDNRRINLTFSLPAPIDQTHDYDVAIEMLEMAVDDVITLSEEQFRCYVKDEWHWKQMVWATNTTYTKGKF